MGFVKSIKSFKWGYLLISTVLCITGTLFVIYPVQSSKITAFIIGGACTAFGIVNIVRVLSLRARGFKFATSIIFSICVIICGIIAFISPNFTVSVYPVVIGLLVIIDGSFKLNTVINAKRYELKLWWFLLIFCCVVILCGFFLIRLRYPEENPVPYIILFGISVFLTGIQNLLSLFYFGKITKRAISHIEASTDEPSPEDAVCADDAK